MSVNVRCAGAAIVTANTPDFLREPCGWEGKRKDTSRRIVSLAEYLTAKPCPHCGGRVELIPEES